MKYTRGRKAVCYDIYPSPQTPRNALCHVSLEKDAKQTLRLYNKSALYGESGEYANKGIYHKCFYVRVQEIRFLQRPDSRRCSDIHTLGYVRLLCLLFLFLSLQISPPKSKTCKERESRCSRADILQLLAPYSHTPCNTYKNSCKCPVISQNNTRHRSFRNNRPESRRTHRKYSTSIDLWREMRQSYLQLT
jgi:hypothetical protein